MRRTVLALCLAIAFTNSNVNAVAERKSPRKLFNPSWLRRVTLSPGGTSTPPRNPTARPSNSNLPFRNYGPISD